ncbi:hypothetical protein [Kitasatospora sp. GP82]|uniref:hypothetical protein n=1 Tax=Kitasatospora sp. GP82 TaxID=3035089 RepID=UPI0024758DD3|nr:hypothetical protein [Kitasatospora sp. GP82]MDH6125927.1 hypothetical protein [Kitasatospora sp. GP82]
MTGDETVRRRWQKLDDEQRALAEELMRRAEALREVSEDGLSIAEAIELAADAVQRRGLAAPRPEAVPDGR